MRSSSKPLIGSACKQIKKAKAKKNKKKAKAKNAMRVSDITGPVGVTRQAFYAHFRDKRHCVAEAIDPKLGAIERMAASLAETDPDAAAAFAHTVDDVIADRFGSPEGTRGRIVNAMIEQLLDDLRAEIRLVRSPERTGHDLPTSFRAFADALNSDPDRRRILVIEMAHLPDSAPEDIAGARKRALAEMVADLLAEALGTDRSDPCLLFAAASVIEVVRSMELAGDTGSLAERLSELKPGLGMGGMAATFEEMSPAA